MVICPKIEDCRSFLKSTCKHKALHAKNNSCDTETVSCTRCKETKEFIKKEDMEL